MLVSSSSTPSTAPTPPIWRAYRRNVGLVAMATLAAKLLGFVEKQVLAHQFGTGPIAEAYFVVSGLLLAVGAVARELTEPVLLPFFVARIGAHDRTAPAWAAFRAFLLATAVLAALLATVLLLGPQAAIHVLAPGLSVAAVALATRLVVFAAAALVFVAAASVTQSALNGLGRFGPPAATDLLNRAFLILGCLAAAKTPLGVGALAAGMLVGATAKLGAQLALLPPSARVSARAPRRETEELRKRVTEAWPLVLGVLLSQCGHLAETRVLSETESGAVAARIYAQRLVELPLVLVPCVLGVVAFPTLARTAAAGGPAAMGRFLSPLLGGTLMAFTPLALALRALAAPVVALTFERGHFDPAATQHTAALLSVYALALPALALEILIVPAFFALKDVRTPVVVGAAGVGANLLGMSLLHERWGAVGVAAALVASRSAKVVVLALLLAARGQGLRRKIWTERIFPFLVALGATLTISRPLRIAQLGRGVRGLLTVGAHGLALVGAFLLVYLLGWLFSRSESAGPPPSEVAAKDGSAS